MFCVSFDVFAIVWSPPLHREEGSGTIIVANRPEMAGTVPVMRALSQLCPD